MQWFVLVEDWSGDGTLGRKCDLEGNLLDPLSAAVSLHSGADGRPAGARAGYYGLWHKDGNTWRFLQSHCPDTSCDQGTSFIDQGTVPEGNANEPYTHTIEWQDLIANPTISSLPTGWGFYITGETGELSAAAPTEGRYDFVVSGFSDPGECPITIAFTVIIRPCDVVDAFVDLDDPPDATVDVAYSHTILFTDVTFTDWTGLPPGYSFNPTTGEISGTHDIEGAWEVIIRATTTPNGCEIVSAFTLKIKPCEPEDSRIYSANDQYSIFTDQPILIEIIGVDTTGDITLDSVQECCPSPPPCTPSAETLPAGLSYDETTGRLTGAPSNAAECKPYPCHYLLTFKGESVTNGCDVWYSLKLYYQCECPEPTDYTTLEAWMINEPGPANSSQSVDLNVPFGETLYCAECVFDSVVGLPPNIEVRSGLGDTELEIDGTCGDAGTYVAEFYGTVTTGPYTGCPITHTRTYTVS